jgi:subtilisin-like proprotein convertase family protein
MKRKHAVRLGVLACASVASLGLITGVSSAAAKSKKKTVTKTATVNQCVNSTSAILDPGDGVTPAAAVVPITVPAYRGVPQTGVVTAISSVGVRITHTYDGDLGLTLISPSGRLVHLALSPDNLAADNSGDGYGSGAQSCTGSLVQFGDQFSVSAATPGNTSNNPITGSLKPLEPLSALAGSQAAGGWTLLVNDNASTDEGTLDALSVNLTYQYKALVKKKAKKKK